MKKLPFYSLLIFSFIMTSCASVNTSYDYDKSADFSKYKTYNYTEHAATLPEVQQLNRDRLLAAIDAEMTKLGFTKSDNPDLLTELNVKAEEQMSATATTYGGGPWGYGYAGGFTTTNVDYNKYTEGTLFISLVDRAAQKIVWQGRGTKTLNEKASPEKREQNIKTAVASIFQLYPTVKK